MLPTDHCCREVACFGFSSNSKAMTSWYIRFLKVNERPGYQPLPWGLRQIGAKNHHPSSVFNYLSINLQLNICSLMSCRSFPPLIPKQLISELKKKSCQARSPLIIFSENRVCVKCNSSRIIRAEMQEDILW